LSFAGIILLFCMFLVYRMLFGLNVRTGGTGITIYIPESSTYTEALDTLDSNLKIKDLKILKWIAEKKNYPSLVKPGRYVINNDMSYPGLINLLRSGSQTPVNVTFNNIRTLNDLAGKIGKQILADSAQIIDFLSAPDNYKKDGFTRDNVISVFIPDTYQFFWNTSAAGLYSRMLKEYRKFWNEERLAKAKEKNLDPVEVAILASIIDDEVRKHDEKPRIAGVYLNRLKRGIPLQACPTIKFALNDFTITRVLKKYLEIDSPYNTYKHYGFPPGPIGCPTIEGIDAVLNAEKHDYLFFAAKADFSGYHNFSRTLSEHNRYAAEYQRELNKRKIFK
ncbi:MAG: Endolytic murein transglycosylase, partial [Bacteroidota bacterium]|nr:Endolytic murein transglycosylase [Bacteroidota bacterium]